MVEAISSGTSAALAPVLRGEGDFCLHYGYMISLASGEGNVRLSRASRSFAVERAIHRFSVCRLCLSFHIALEQAPSAPKVSSVDTFCVNTKR